jgi:amidohydrolase
MDQELLKHRICAAVDAAAHEIHTVVQRLYEFAEVGLEEVRSAALLTDLLMAHGFTVAKGVAGMPTAFAARTGHGTPHVALLAEMDALPKMGHACGHNIIAAAACGAAMALRAVLPPELLSVTVFGTPAEELGHGKVAMLEAGLFDGVDFAMMVHPSSRRQVVKQYLGLARLQFVFTGRPAHAAAYPEEGINALDGVIQTFNAINALRQQLRQDVRVHGIITDGGRAPNIIPERAACFYYVRADDVDEVERTRERVIACARGAALATGCQLEIEQIGNLLAPLRINRRFSALYSAQLAWLGLPEANRPPDKNKGSSDIGNVSQQVPTIHPHVPIGDGLHIHSEAFARATITDQGLAAAVEGAKALGLTALGLALAADVRAEICQEFAGKTN